MMLVLSRRAGESLLIYPPSKDVNTTVPPPIIVTVLDARYQQARIGIDAPLAYRIARAELAPD